MTFEAVALAAQMAAERSMLDASGSGIVFGIDPETWRFWKANAGNAKARRRWRRRNVTNTQKKSGG